MKQIGYYNEAHGFLHDELDKDCYCQGGCSMEAVYTESQVKKLTGENKTEKLQEQLNTAKNALTEIAYTRQEIWRGGTLVGFEATEDAKIAYDALAAIGWDGCPVGLVVKNGLTKEELEGSGDE